jgi:anti-sigma-K factor RskA
VKYASPKLRQLLAAQYALGTLSGRACRRFQRLLAADGGLRAELVIWETRLASLGLRLKPVAPRDIVWLDLLQRLQTRVVPLQPAAPAESPRGEAGSGHLALWRTWAALATAASLLLGFQLWQTGNQPPAPPQIVRVEVPVVQPAPPAYVAMLQSEKAGATWLVSVSPEQGRMNIKVLAGSPADAKHDCQLWVIADGKPVSIGVIPRSGGASMPWPSTVAFAEGLTVAVSMEPAGGSPTGQPTGPVIAAAPVTKVG